VNTSFERGDQKEEWLTPKPIIDALGPFDLDPCASVVRPWEIATTHYTIEDNGLLKPWNGFVWCNPPYGQETKKWFRRMLQHGNGIALTFARVETKMFFESVWGGATAVLFLQGRISFWEQSCATCAIGQSKHKPLPKDPTPEQIADWHEYKPSGKFVEGDAAGAPSCLIAFGNEAEARLHRSELRGVCINLKHSLLLP
jgi:hypothetical protein